ncbi:MAG: phosphatase PAP2 family protein [Oscillospiraceae bacterium]|nr:phosphatase PAP2 family protein [Oscillospiraceae bacterium]
MAFLKYLEGIRTPAGDAFFSTVTHLGEELLFIVVGLLIFWCLDKRSGFYLLLVSFSGAIVNQFLKLFVRMPRPWILDPTLTIVESARAQALGFSFPSGHTQNAVSVFGSIAVCFKHRIVRIVCAVLAVLVAFSRLYLGVHTPLDVLTAVGIALPLLCLCYHPAGAAMQSVRVMAGLLFGMIALGAAFTLYAECCPLPTDAEAEFVRDGVKNAWSLFGASLGFALGMFLNRRYLHFEVKAVWWAQLLKLTLGLAILLALRTGLKTLLLPIGHPSVHALRYFVILVFATAVWPSTFGFFSRLGTKKRKMDKS